MSGTQTYPRLFGKYAIVAPLARGGMGELHLALSGEAELKKLCVIKQIIGHLSDREFVRRFLDEAKLVIKLSHQNLVPIFESGVEDGQYYLVMEYIEGKDLRAVWRTLQEQKRTCPLEVSLHIVKEICRGLSYAHTYGELELVHRDISPPNVLLSYPGEVRITDFGLASSRLKVQKTAPGILFGKLAYMSPEQARNEPIDPRTDIFAVGVIFWEFVTGQRLFPRKGTQLEQLQRAANPTIPRPSQVKKGLPAAVDLIALRALAPNREDRYPTAEALRRDIAGLLAKIAPTTDNASVAQLLRDLYGDAISTDRQDRKDLLERLTPAIRRLRDEAKSRRSAPRDLAGTAQELTNEDEGDDLTDELAGQKPIIEPGTVLGNRYRIEAMLREGGMGIVYSATHTGIDKIVAVKVLHPAYSRMPDVVSRFRREARAASRIGHPNIIEIFDSGETDEGAVYFVMEHLIGQDLADLLEDAGALPIDRVLGIAGQVCQAVEAAHEAGIVHRDLKPENIFLVPREGQVDFVKILDFGIAQNTHLDESRKERLTHPGMPMGTPEYMAPEQAAGLGADHRSDIYAVGAILYEMVAGQAIHGGDNLLAVLTAKAKGDIPPLREIRPDVPAVLEHIITWALAPEPDDRPQSIGHMAYELTKLTGGRAGAVASMLGLSDLAPSRAAVDLSTLDRAGDRKTKADHDPKAPSPPKTRSTKDDSAASRDRDLDSDSDSQPQRRTAEVSLTEAPARKPRRWIIGVLIAASIGVGAYLMGRGSGRPGPSAPPPRRSPDAKKLPSGGARLDARRAAASTQPTTHPASVTSQPSSTTTAPAPGPSTQPSAPSPVIVSSHPPRSLPKGKRLLILGRRHLKKGRFRQATAALKAASRYPRYRAAALLGLAEVAFQKGDYETAAGHAAAARKRGGGWHAALALANYLYRLNRLRAAAREYEGVLAAHPDNAEARRGLTRTRKLLRRPP